jgi:hypothetical protein
MGHNSKEAHDAETAQRSGWERLLDWITKYWVALAGVSALTAYAMTWVAATLFYSQLDLQPAEVGLGYGELLQKAVGLVVFAVVLIAGGLLLLIGMTALVAGVEAVAALLKQRSGAPEQQRRAVGSLISERLRDVWIEETEGKAWKAPVSWGVVPGVTVAVVFYLFLGFAYGSAVHNGIPVTGSSAAIWFPAEHAQVFGISLDKSIDQHCLLYLGTENETAVLWDGKNHRVVRVPTRTGATVVISGDESKCP